MFDFKIHYVLETDNIHSDAQSQIYSNKLPSTICSHIKYMKYDRFIGDVLVKQGMMALIVTGTKKASQNWENLEVNIVT